MAGRVLITGLSSFTGPYLEQRLTQQGYEVVGIGNAEASPTAENVYPANILDADSLTETVHRLAPDFVVHLAAITFVPHADLSEMYLTNIVGTRNLLEALAGARSAPKRVILASSANVYGNAIEGDLNEATPFSPANDYAASKVGMEMMARIWSDRLPISIVRPFNYTGVGQTDKFLIPKIVNHFRRREAVVELGNIDVTRDFSDVRFVADAYTGLLQQAADGQVYNICSGNGYSLKQLIAEMNELAGYEIEVRVNPAFVRENEVKHLVGDNDRLLSTCAGLSPISMSETLSWMYSAKS